MPDCPAFDPAFPLERRADFSFAVLEHCWVVEYLDWNMVMIRRLRSFAAVACAGLFSQLILAGSGFACGMPTMSHAQVGVATGAAMAGMEMPASEQPTPSPSDEAPCHLPWAPAGCQPMAPCAPALMTSAMVTFDGPAPVVETVREQHAIAPPTRTVPPELPPPRA